MQAHWRREKCNLKSRQLSSIGSSLIEINHQNKHQIRQILILKKTIQRKMVGEGRVREGEEVNFKIVPIAAEITRRSNSYPMIARSVLSLKPVPVCMHFFFDAFLNIQFFIYSRMDGLSGNCILSRFLSRLFSRCSIVVYVFVS